MHNNWLLGECFKLEQCYDCQRFNCARATTLGNQVRYLRIARAVVNIHMFIYLYVGLVSVMGDILAKHLLVGTMDLAVVLLTPYTHTSTKQLDFHSAPWFWPCFHFFLHMHRCVYIGRQVRFSFLLSKFQPVPLDRHLPHIVQLRDLPFPAFYSRRHLHQDIHTPQQVATLIFCWNAFQKLNENSEFYRHWLFSKVKKILLIFRRSRHIQTAPTSDNFLSESKNSKIPMGPPKRSVLKALKMSVLHVAFFILSWTPYTVMSTWWGSFFRREILIITPGTPLTAHLVTVTPERYKMIFNISNWVQELEYNLIILLTK